MGGDVEVRWWSSNPDHGSLKQNSGQRYTMDGPRYRAFSKHFLVLLANLALCVSQSGCSISRFSSVQKELSKVNNTDGMDLAKRRERMVQEQLETRDIADPRVLSAMRKVPRHEFVPAEFIPSAYEDNALPLKSGQTISQPYIVAYMTQALELKGNERVLEIGTGSGYQTAILAEIVQDVFSIEILPDLQQQACAVLSRLGYRNIRFRVGDGYMGWPEHAPYDRIIVTAAPERIPQPLIDQLKEGGRLIVPVGTSDQELTILEKGPSGTTQHSTIPVRFVPMTGKAQERE
jgi:protein-L-isoaspartate(D-aspartate) O-methyltransferase